MIKKFLLCVMATFAGYASNVLALWAEFGSQLMMPGFRSNSDYRGLVATRYIFVQGTGAFRAHQATNATSTNILGVMQNNPDVDEAMSIAVSGLSKVVAGGAIAALGLVTSNSSGRAAAVTSGDILLGRALEATTTDGDIVTVMLCHPVRWSGA